MVLLVGAIGHYDDCARNPRFTPVSLTLNLVGASGIAHFGLVHCSPQLMKHVTTSGSAFAASAGACHASRASGLIVRMRIGALHAQQPQAVCSGGSTCRHPTAHWSPKVCASWNACVTACHPAQWLDTKSRLANKSRSTQSSGYKQASPCACTHLVLVLQPTTLRLGAHFLHADW